MRLMPFACRVFAVFLVLSAVGSIWAPFFIPARVPIRIELTTERVRAVNSHDPAVTRVRIGDRFDMRGLSRVGYFDQLFGSVYRPVRYSLIDASGRPYLVTAAPVVLGRAAGFNYIPLLFVCFEMLIALTVAIVLLLRRPSAMALTFAMYCAYAIPGTPLVIGLGWIDNETLRGLLQQASYILTNALPAVAIITFAIRFPTPPTAPLGVIAMHVADAVLVLAVIGGLIVPPHILKTLIVPLGVIGTIVLIVIVSLRYAAAGGATRRQLSWVLVGSVVSAGAAVMVLFVHDFYASAALQVIGTAALTLSVAYTVLRHRVIDIGFAINRTLVYGILTTTIVVGVAVVDWLASRLLSQTRLATALEALVTIAFGVGLNSLHERVGRFVERTLFRERHRAMQRVAELIVALDYAESPATVDDIITREWCAILGLRSAALFRSFNDAGLTRTSAIGWENAAIDLPRDHVLALTMRAHERTVMLAAAGIDCADFPHGDLRPDIAIPIVRRHRVMGIVFYGHRPGDLTIDPQERALLERGAVAAANAYDSIEAAEWRHELRPDSVLGAAT